jgi:hypothetical protein
MKSIFLAAMTLVLATPALAATYAIPATVATDRTICPKKTIVASEPGSTITAEHLPGLAGNSADIDLKAGTVRVSYCAFKIKGFANAIGAPWGSTLTGDDNANILTGIASNQGGAASDWIIGNGGNDVISVRANTATVQGGAGKDRFRVPADRKMKIGKKTYTIAIVEDLATGETLTRR